MKSLARPAVARVMPYAPGKPIEEVRRELGLRRVIKLASNENPLGPSPKALAAMREALPELHRYPDSHAFYLTRALSRKLKVGADQIIVGNGSDELITLALKAFVDPGDEVVTAKPTFLIYRIAAQIAAARLREIPLKDLRYDLVRMRQAITPKTKIVFIANPDNPTGTYVTKAELERFFAGLPKRVIVFLDEAYAELADARDYPDTRRYLKTHPVIITRTFSKAYGLSGIRVGYGLGPRELIQAMHRVREPFNVNALAQAAARAALSDSAHLAATRRLLRREKPFLYRGLARLGLTAVPSATNFILFQVGPRAGQVARALLRRGIIVRDLRAWNLSNHLRVTVGLPSENRAFMKALKEELKR
jgi:histidinol-phosphate aminotransferase